MNACSGNVAVSSWRFRVQRAMISSVITHAKSKRRTTYGAIVGKALYSGAFTLPEALDVAGR